MENKKNIDKSLGLIAKSSVVVLAGIIFSKVLSYIFRIIVAREFGPEIYGLFSLSIMLLGWITVAALFGFRDGLVRYISLLRGENKEDDIKNLFRKSLLFLSTTGFIGGAILFIFAEPISLLIFNEPNLVIFIKIIAIGTPFAVLTPLLFSVFRAYEKIELNVLLSHVLISVIHVCGLILFIWVGLGSTSVPLSYSLGNFIAFIGGIIMVYKIIPNLVRKPKSKNNKIFKEVFSYSWPLLFAGIIWSIFHWTDSFLIGVFTSAEEVGLYNSAIPIASLLFVSYELFSKLFYPMINKEYGKGNIEVVKQLSQQVGKWVLVINLPIFLLLLFFPEAILNILFGQDFSAASDSLRVLSIGSLFLAVSSVSNRLITMAGKSKTIFLHIIIAAPINIILNILLIPRYGILGAAISTSFSFILISAMSLIQAYTIVKILPIRRKVINAIMAGTASIFVILYLRSIFSTSSYLGLALIFLLFGLTYLVALFVFGAFDKHDKLLFEKIIKKRKKKSMKPSEGISSL